MPLSEHEQRVLEQIERSLYADDPKFAATVRGIDPRARQRRRYARSAVGLVVGIALIGAGAFLDLGELTAIGAVVAVLALVYAAVAWQHSPRRAERARAADRRRGPFGRAPRNARAQGRRAPHGHGRHGIMQRFEDRWNRRREGLGN